MSARRPLVALIAAVAVVASGLVSGGAASAAPAVDPAPGGYAPGPIAWSKCKGDDFPKNFQCGTVAVPRDWNDVGGARITLAVTRVRHTTKRYQGVMLTNPGGPGGSGTYLPVLKDAVPKGAGDSYDWIGFDPRGVAASEPSLSCIRDYFTAPRPPYIPSTAAIEKAWTTRSKAYAAACARKNAAILPHITTADTVKDMDAIRVALGREQINYFGFSYGTTLGQTYATVFPSHLRRAVFDSNTDPRKSWFDYNFDQDASFEKVFRVYARWIAKYDRVYHLGRTQATVIRAYEKARDGLDRKRVGPVGGDEFSDTVNPAGYTQALWPAVAEFLSKWIVKHDRKALISGYRNLGAQPDDNLNAVYTATICNESPWPATYSVYRADSWRVARVAPFETWANSWLNAPCLYWPLPRQQPVEIDGGSAPAVLLIDETLDGATDYAGSVETRRRFPKSVLLAEPGGTTHAGSLNGNVCVDRTIARYLDDGTLPARKAGNGADRTCAPLPQPTPGSGSGSGPSSGDAALARLRGGVLR